jgi:hypothetical protein
LRTHAPRSGANETEPQRSGATNDGVLGGLKAEPPAERGQRNKAAAKRSHNDGVLGGLKAELRSKEAM